MDKNIEDFIRANALENALSFGGKANPKAMIGRVVANFPEVKSDMKSLMDSINSIVDEVNSMSALNQKKEAKELSKHVFKKERVIEEKDGLPKLPNTQNGVRVRFPPAPSGHLHIGHLLGIVANYEFKKKYGGDFILRIEDTNPENTSIENYDKVIEDVKWVCDDNVDEIYYQSDRLEEYYKIIKKLFSKNACYVCTCEPESFKEYTDKKEECPHRKMSTKEKIKQFESFMRGEIEGVLRATADINNKNPALRSFPLARVNKTSHPRVDQKYSVWPNYNLAVTVDDYMMKLTHVIRGKDLEIGELRQKMLAEVLNWKMPEYFHFGLLNFIDIELSKSKLSEKIEKGIYTGWDDPRVPSLLSHRKRGYQAEAFRKLILKQGISKRDSKITKDEYYKSLDFFNKEILEKKCSRYFFVSYDKKPKLVYIDNVDEIGLDKLSIQKHPEDKSKGIRELIVERKNYVDFKDFEKMKIGDLIRLKNFANFEVVELDSNHIHLKFVSKEYNKKMKLKMNIQFVPLSQANECQIIMDNNSILKGFAEDTKKEENVQFERFAFVRYDREEKDKKIYYFTHR